MTRIFLPLIALAAVVVFSACGDDNDDPKIDAPATYVFERDGASSVSFSGQTTRILMAQELITAMKDFDRTSVELQEMFANQKADGSDANPFADADLNASTKSIRSKTAASKDYFSGNTFDAAAIKEEFASWLSAQVNEVFPNENQLAAAGVAGQIADGSSTRYVNGKGLEYNQAFNKGLIGALMADQALNNYLSPAVLDDASNRAENDNGTVASGKTYTTMEHKWDEAYGYLYGTAADKADPNATIGSDDSFLNKYIGRVEGDDDFAGIAKEIFDAFKLGRAAIVAKNYKVRDEQAEIIREKVSEVIGVRAVYYLQQGKKALEATPVDYGAAFHDLSEGFGFIYSLQFTRQPNSSSPYLTRTEVKQILDDLMAGNGFWDVTPATLDAISEQIAGKFNFTVSQAGN